MEMQNNENNEIDNVIRKNLGQIVSKIESGDKKFIEQFEEYLITHLDSHPLLDEKV